MNKREEILNQALEQNEQETVRWTKYQDEQNVSIENLDTFSKKLEVDVMVPIGPKALISGRLHHTNEVYVNHYGKIFSKCTVFQAKKICQHRIVMAKNQLEKLSTERELFTNKLNIPHTDGVVPNDDEFEIIEKYDEENEKLWQEKHKINLRESKRKEKLEKNENSEVNLEKLMEKLNELELMDELETELDDLGVQDNETLQKLINGEIKVTEKKRISHLNNNKNKRNENENELNFTSAKTLETKSLIDEITENKSISDSPEKQLSDEMSDNDTDDSSTYEVPKEIITMEEQIEGLSSKEQIQFYKKNITCIEKEIESMIITNPDELDKKMHKIEIREYLIDLVSILEDQIDEKIEIDYDDNVKVKKKTKRITFALEDQIKYIDNTEKVEDMFKTDSEKRRDIISLDPEFELCSQKHEITENTSNNIIKKKDIIAEKVEKNLNYVQEMQSHEDFDLVGKILGTTNQKAKTLTIKFHHSNQINQNQLNNDSNNKFQLGNPTDFYTLFADKYPQNIDASKIYNNTNENQNEEAYKDLKTEICTLVNQKTKSNQGISSILKNKEYEPPKINLSEEQDDNLSLNHFDYDSIVGDVIENRITVPEPLPDVKYVDSHAPKKRVSRFKQSRTMKTV